MTTFFFKICSLKLQNKKFQFTYCTNSNRDTVIRKKRNTKFYSKDCNVHIRKADILAVNNKRRISNKQNIPDSKAKEK